MKRRESLASFLKALVIIYLTFFWNASIAGDLPVRNAVYELDIPQQDLATALTTLSNQIGTPLLFPYNLVQNKESHSVKGIFTVRKALDQMLLNTGLTGSYSEKGVLTVSLLKPYAANERLGEDAKNDVGIKYFGLRRFLAKFMSRGARAETSSVVGQGKKAVEKAGPIEEVIVSASRVISRPGYEAPTPTTVFDKSTINATAQVSVASVLNQMPALGAPTSPRTSGNVVGGGTQGANFLNLRSLGLGRTLVLLDGHRVVGAATTGSVDINLIPTTLLERVEVVTGGASAAWGSDAVAGVVNMVLDKEFVGFKGSIQGGNSNENDAEELRIDFAGGLEFSDGRGHVVASATYTDTGSVDRADSRSWLTGEKIITNPNYVAGNGEPRNIRSKDVGTYFLHDGGIIPFGPLANTYFDSNGQPQPFIPGHREGILQLGGTSNDLSASQQLLSEYEQTSLFLRADYDISDGINFYGEAAYGHTVADSHSVSFFTFPLTTIYRDNAFLPTATAAAMDSAGVTSFGLGRTNQDLGESNPHNIREMHRFLIGVDMDLDDNWKMEAYLKHGTNDVKNQVRNDGIRAHYNLAVDAVFDSGGNIVCRSTLTNPGNGCVPLNVFGFGSASAEAAEYTSDGVAEQNIKLTQDVAAISFSGDVFELPAGQISTAFGLEYREEDHYADADEISKINGFWVGNYKPSAGGYDVKEVFAEVVIPVFQDSALGNALDFNAAIRVTDYSTSGMVQTWKTGFTYDVGKGLSFRAVASRDIRAPNLEEYYLAGSSRSQEVQDTITHTGTAFILSTTAGTTKLDPELADTRTFGIVYQPEFIEGLTLSADYFNIEIQDAIGRIGNQDTVDGCAAGDAVLCERVIRNGSGTITEILLLPINNSLEVLTGTDIEAEYVFDAAGGTFRLRSLWTYSDEHYREDGFGVRDDMLGEVALLNAGPFRWRGMTSLAYANDLVNFTLRHRYVGEGKLNADWVSGVDIDDNSVESVSYFDLTASANLNAFGMDMEVFGSIENLLDENPPSAPQVDRSNVQATLGVSGATHDLIGRYFRAGIRFKM